MPASTYCRSRGHGLYFESPVPSKITFMMAKQVSSPAQRAMPRVGDPVRWHPLCDTVVTAWWACRHEVQAQQAPFKGGMRWTDLSSRRASMAL